MKDRLSLLKKFPFFSDFFMCFDSQSTQHVCSAYSLPGPLAEHFIVLSWAGVCVVFTPCLYTRTLEKGRACAGGFTAGSVELGCKTRVLGSIACVLNLCGCHPSNQVIKLTLFSYFHPSQSIILYRTMLVMPLQLLLPLWGGYM